MSISVGHVVTNAPFQKLRRREIVVGVEVVKFVRVLNEQCMDSPLQSAPSPQKVVLVWVCRRHVPCTSMRMSRPWEVCATLPGPSTEFRMEISASQVVEDHRGGGECVRGRALHLGQKVQMEHVPEKCCELRWKEVGRHFAARKRQICSGRVHRQPTMTKDVVVFWSKFWQRHLRLADWGSEGHIGQDNLPCGRVGQFAFPWWVPATPRWLLKWWPSWRFNVPPVGRAST